MSGITRPTRWASKVEVRKLYFAESVSSGRRAAAEDGEGPAQNLSYERSSVANLAFALIKNLSRLPYAKSPTWVSPRAFSRCELVRNRMRFFRCACTARRRTHQDYLQALPVPVGERALAADISPNV